MTSDMRIDLDVPYHQKNDAKKLGARWDPSGKVWYVPSGVDPKPFARWRRNDGFNLRTAEAYLVRSPTRCWSCTAPFDAIGFLLAPGFEMKEFDEDERGDRAEDWSRQQDWRFAYYITDLSAAVVDMLKREAPSYRRAFSKTTETTYWANHCPKCGALRGDFYLFEEFDGAFSPISVEHVLRMKATRLTTPFEANGQSSFGIDNAHLMPGVRSHRANRRRGAGADEPPETIHIQPLVGQAASPPRLKRQCGLIVRLKSLLGIKR